MTARCPNCGADAPLAFRTSDRNRRLSDAEFPYFRCPGCGLLFLHPIPQDLGRYYPPSYYGVPATLRELEAMARVDQYKIDLVQRFVPKGRLLEIGPAYGAFALLAARAGYDVECIEYDAACVAFLRRVVGVRAQRSSDAAAVLQRERGEYDVICSWQNLEHLPDARATFGAAARRLAPGGALIIATPNPNSLQLRLFGQAWTHIDAPRHVVLLPMPLLREWGKSEGLTPRLLTTTDRGSRGWNRFGWEQTLANFGRSRPVRFALRAIGLGLTLLALPLELTGDRGSCYTAVFVRDRA